MITQVFFGKEVRIGKVTIPAYHKKDNPKITVQKTGDTFAFFHQDFPGVAYCTSVTNVKSWTVEDVNAEPAPSDYGQTSGPHDSYDSNIHKEPIEFNGAPDQSVVVPAKKTPGRKKKVTNG